MKGRVRSERGGREMRSKKGRLNKKYGTISLCRQICASVCVKRDWLGRGRGEGLGGEVGLRRKCRRRGGCIGGEGGRRGSRQGRLHLSHTTHTRMFTLINKAV